MEANETRYTWDDIGLFVKVIRTFLIDGNCGTVWAPVKAAEAITRFEELYDEEEIINSDEFPLEEAVSRIYEVLRMARNALIKEVNEQHEHEKAILRRLLQLYKERSPWIAELQLPKFLQQ